VTATTLIILIAALLAVSFYGYRNASNRAQRVRRLAANRDKPAVTADFSTPEGAILMLEQAFRQRDLEAAVLAKDFRTEAELELGSSGTTRRASDSEITARAAELEQRFRAMMQSSWPDFSGVESHFVDRESYPPPVGLASARNLAVVSEVNRFRQGGYSEHRILVAEGAQGWRVLNPL
jgi:hypothetical protein